MKKIDFLAILNKCLQWLLKMLFLLLIFLLFLVFVLMENIGKVGVRTVYPLLFNKNAPH